MFITFLQPFWAKYSSSDSFSFLGETAETQDNEVNNFEHVYFPLAATVQNDSQIDEPEIRQAPALNERVI